MSETAQELERKTLREWRDYVGLTQVELSELSGLSPSAISDYENGRLRLWGANCVRLAEALGVDQSQIIRVGRGDVIREVDVSWWEDGFSDEAPVMKLRGWRERRQLSQGELEVLSGVGATTISNIENDKYRAITAAVRRKLTKALALRPDKLILPGDKTAPVDHRDIEDVLRAELRGARRALRLAFDFLREDPNIAFRSLESRDKVLEVVMREMKGT